MRTVAVFVGAVFLSLAFGTALSHVLNPNGAQLIARIFSTPRSSPEWNEIWRQWHHVNMISLFVVDPLVGVLAGAFVGLLQRNRVLLVAAGSQLPDFVFSLLTDRAKTWATCASGVLFFAIERSLPFITAMFVGWVCYRFIRSRRPRPVEAHV